MSEVPDCVSEYEKDRQDRLAAQQKLITHEVVGTPTDANLGNSIRSFKSMQHDIYNKHLLDNIADRVEQLVKERVS